MAHMTDAESAEVVQSLDGWTLIDRGIEKEFTFEGFPEAIDFLSRLVPDAEAANHHPDITVNYRRVRLRWTTHSEGGLTLKDVEGAHMADRHAGARAR
jgi:4a-hydroxytetrahydrobiopterin dehydratase